MSKPYKTILITGAAGRLGTELRRGLAPLADRLRLADVAEIKDIQPNEGAMVFDLADEAAPHRRDFRDDAPARRRAAEKLEGRADEDDLLEIDVEDRAGLSGVREEELLRADECGRRARRTLLSVGNGDAVRRDEPAGGGLALEEVARPDEGRDEGDRATRAWQSTACVKGGRT